MKQEQHEKDIWRAKRDTRGATWKKKESTKGAFTVFVDNLPSDMTWDWLLQIRRGEG